MEKNIGFVQIPLEQYNKLILENYRLNMDMRLALTQAIKDSFRIENDYEDEPILVFEYRNFVNVIESLLAESKYAGKYR